MAISLDDTNKGRRSRVKFNKDKADDLKPYEMGDVEEAKSLYSADEVQKTEDSFIDELAEDTIRKDSQSTKKDKRVPLKSIQRLEWQSERLQESSKKSDKSTTNRAPPIAESYVDRSQYVAESYVDRSQPVAESYVDRSLIKRRASYIEFLMMRGIKKQILVTVKEGAFLVNGVWHAEIKTSVIEERTGSKPSTIRDALNRMKVEGWFETISSSTAGSRVVRILSPESLELGET
jgi:hypothetical protein